MRWSAALLALAVSASVPAAVPFTAAAATRADPNSDSKGFFNPSVYVVEWAPDNWGWQKPATASPRSRSSVAT